MNCSSLCTVCQLPFICAWDWHLNLLAFGFCFPGQDPLSLRVSSFRHTSAQGFAHYLAWFWFRCSAFLHTFTPTAPFLWNYLSIFENPNWFSILVACAMPFPSSLHPKELKRFGFPPWPPRISLLPYSCLSLQIVVLSIPQNIVGLLSPALVFLFSSYSHAWAAGSLVRNPPCALCVHRCHGRLQWSHSLPISDLLSLALTDTSERTELHSATPMIQGKRKWVSPSLSLSASLFISCWQIWGIPGLHPSVTCIEPVPLVHLSWTMASLNPNTWSNMFLPEVFPPKALPVLAKPGSWL